jgi:hypothetical protein
MILFHLRRVFVLLLDAEDTGRGGGEDRVLSALSLAARSVKRLKEKERAVVQHQACGNQERVDFFFSFP